MATSVFLLAADAEHVARVRSHIAGPVPRFFALLQRCVWGLSQADLVKVDVSRALSQLLAEYGQLPISQLVRAYVQRHVDRAQADAALRKARSLSAPSDPWRFMLPSEDDWNGEVAPQHLQEVVPGRVWRVQALQAAAPSSLHVGSVATLVRGERGELVFINPVVLDEGALAQVRELGALRAIAVQGRAHSRCVVPARAQFPEAKVYLTQGHRTHPASAHLSCDGLLDDGSGVLPDEFQLLPIRGTEADEVVILHRPTQLLIAQDLVSNNRVAHHARSFAGRLEYFAFGLIDRIGMLSYHPLLWHDLAAFQRSLRAVLACDYRSVTAAHWPIVPCGGDEKRAFEATLEFVIALSRPRQLALLAAFFSRQPGFLRDLLRYKRR